jgi:hypothetical protein
VTTLLAAAALLMVGAAPVSAAPGGVPGPPPDHGNPHQHQAPAADTGDDLPGPPDWANAYGWRIQTEYGMTYGHLQQCAGVSDESATPTAETDDVAPQTECPEEAVLEFLGDVHGAMAFWVATHNLIIGT